MAAPFGTHYIQFRYNELLRYWKVLECQRSTAQRACEFGSNSLNYVGSADDDVIKEVSGTPKFRRTYSGEVTKGSKRRIQQAVNNLLMKAEKRKVFNPITQKTITHHLSFITLTFSQSSVRVSLKDGYNNFLSKFLDNGKRTWGIENYVWKAEYQRNGQLHYHITTDAFIRYDVIKTYWNNLQRKAGFIDMYRAEQLEFHKNGFKLREDLLDDWTEPAQIAAYEKGMIEDWQHPNSTDIHAVYKVKDIQSYLVKYLSKPAMQEEDYKKDFDGDTLLKGGKIWGCSKNFMGLGYYESPEDSLTLNEARMMMRKNEYMHVPLEHCQIIKWKSGSTKDKASKYLRDEFKAHLSKNEQTQ